jgi:hypothetical protein
VRHKTLRRYRHRVVKCAARAGEAAYVGDLQFAPLSPLNELILPLTVY